MLSIDDLAKEYQTIEEWKALAQAQQKQVNTLTKKVKELEAEKKDLKKQIEQVPAKSTQVIEFPGQSNILLKSDVETIAQVQLQKLKEISFDRELTLEEAKRVEIFNKVILSNKVKSNDIDAQSKEFSEEELIGLLADDSGK